MGNHANLAGVAGPVAEENGDPIAAGLFSIANAINGLTDALLASLPFDIEVVDCDRTGPADPDASTAEAPEGGGCDGAMCQAGEQSVRVAGTDGRGRDVRVRHQGPALVEDRSELPLIGNGSAVAGCAAGEGCCAGTGADTTRGPAATR